MCGVASVIASASGAVFDRIGLRRGYLAACALLAAALLLLGTVGGHPLAAFAAAVLFGVFYNTVVAAHGIWSARVFADHPSAGLAAVNTALTIGMLAGPTIAGASITHLGYPTTLIAAGVVILAALGFCPPNARRRRLLAEHRCEATPVRGERGRP